MTVPVMDSIGTRTWGRRVALTLVSRCPITVGVLLIPACLATTLLPPGLRGPASVIVAVLAAVTPAVLMAVGFPIASRSLAEPAVPPFQSAVDLFQAAAVVAVAVYLMSSDSARTTAQSVGPWLAATCALWSAAVAVLNLRRARRRARTH